MGGATVKPLKATCRIDRTLGLVKPVAVGYRTCSTAVNVKYLRMFTSRPTT